MLLYGCLEKRASCPKICCTISALKCVPKVQPLAVRPPSNLLLEICANLQCKSAVRLLYGLAVRPFFLKNRAKNLPCCVLKLLNCLAENVLLKCCLGMRAKLLPPSPHCPEISLALLLSFSQSAHERMNDLFLLFLL